MIAKTRGTQWGVKVILAISATKAAALWGKTLTGTTIIFAVSVNRTARVESTAATARAAAAGMTGGVILAIRPDGAARAARQNGGAVNAQLSNGGTEAHRTVVECMSTGRGVRVAMESILSHSSSNCSVGQARK